MASVTLKHRFSLSIGFLCKNYFAGCWKCLGIAINQMMLAGYNIGPKIMRLMKYVLPKQSWISLTPEYLLKSYMSQERECLFNDSEGTQICWQYFEWDAFI